MNLFVQSFMAVALSLAADSAAAQKGMADVPVMTTGGSQTKTVIPGTNNGSSGIIKNTGVGLNASGLNVKGVSAQTVSPDQVGVQALAVGKAARATSVSTTFRSNASTGRPGERASVSKDVSRLGENIKKDAAGDSASVSVALNLAYDAAKHGGAGTGAARNSIPGKIHDLNKTIAIKIGVANVARPADAPALYQDAIKTAQAALPGPVSLKISEFVRGLAASKADAALGPLAADAYRAANDGLKQETVRQLSAFDQWETLLGTKIGNLPALKKDVMSALQSAVSGKPVSMPHIWFSKTGDTYTAVLPHAAAVTQVPRALAAAFKLALSAPAPEALLGDAYRAYVVDRRDGFRLIYDTHRKIGRGMVPAALSAGRFWLWTAVESLWRRIAAAFGFGATSYDLSGQAGQDALRRDAALATTAREEAAAADQRLTSEHVRVGDMYAALDALGRAASALDAGARKDASAAVAQLRQSFDASARSLKPSDDAPTGLIYVPGGLLHWSKLIQDQARRSLQNARAAGGAGVVNLGAKAGSAAMAAAQAKALVGDGASFVVIDETILAHGGGPFGAVRLGAQLRGTTSGGWLELSVERGDAALERRLENLGLTIFRDGTGLRVVAEPEDISRNSEELGFLAVLALADALGKGSIDENSAVNALIDSINRDKTAAARLAEKMDGRAAFARAPVIGAVGAYEALAPTLAIIDGRPMLVSALRDPDTGLLAYARAAGLAGLK